MTSAPFAAAACVLSIMATLAGQAEVAPVALSTVEGSSSNPFLFGRANEVRIMDVYDRSQLPASFGNLRLIKRIVLRADTRNNTTLYPKKRNIDLTLNLSTSHETAESSLLMFDEMHGSDRTSVFRGRLDLPLQPIPSTPVSPRPLNVVIPFPTPWFYNLSPRRGGPTSPGTLVVDYQVHDKVTSSDYVLDMAGFCASKSNTFGLGVKCLGSTGKRLTLAASDRAYANNALVYSVTGVIPDNALTLLLSIGPFGNWPSIPIDQAGQCFINMPPMLTQVSKGDKLGNGRFQYPIPRTQVVVGVGIHAQAVAYDINANSAEHVSSLGVSTSVCGPFGVCQLMQLNGQASRAVLAQSNVYGLAHVIGF